MSSLHRLFTLLFMLAVSCVAPRPPMPEKITFSLGAIREDGLRGPPDGLTSLAYEFCIPNTPEARAEVSSLDPSIQFHPHSRGRIGCGEGQCLCMGSTHQAGWRDVLLRLSSLPYITRIQECFWE